MTPLRSYVSSVVAIALLYWGCSDAKDLGRVLKNAGVTRSVDEAIRGVGHGSAVSPSRGPRLHRRAADDFTFLPDYPFGDVPENELETMADWEQSGARTSTCVCRSSGIKSDAHGKDEWQIAAVLRKLDEAYDDIDLINACENTARKDLFDQQAVPVVKQKRHQRRLHADAAYFYNVYGWTSDQCHCYAARTEPNYLDIVGEVIARCEKRAGIEAAAATLSRIGGLSRGRARYQVPYLPPPQWTPPPEASAFGMASLRGTSPLALQRHTAARPSRVEVGRAATQGAHLLRDGADAAARMAQSLQRPQQLREGLGRFARQVGEKLAKDVKQNTGLAASTSEAGTGAARSKKVPYLLPVTGRGH